MGKLKKILSFFVAFIFCFFAYNVSVKAEQTINVKVDMTVLWGSTLPDEVYMYVFQPNGGKFDGGSDVAGLKAVSETGTLYDMGGFSGKSTDMQLWGYTQPNLGKALKLKNRGDGIYEGQMKYQGGFNTTVQSRLYVSPDDDKNYMQHPRYEQYTRTWDNPYTPIVDWGTEAPTNLTFRVINLQTNGEQTLYWAWENKYPDKFKFENDVTMTSPANIYQGTEYTIKTKCFYTNNDSNHFQWVTDYIPDANIIIESGEEYVTKVGNKIIAKNTGDTEIREVTVRVEKLSNKNELDKVVERLKIKIMPTNFAPGKQTIVAYPDLKAGKFVSSEIVSIVEDDGRITTEAAIYTFKGDFELESNILKAYKVDEYKFITGLEGSYTPTSYLNFNWQAADYFSELDGIKIRHYNYTATEVKNAVVIPVQSEARASMLPYTFKIVFPKLDTDGKRVKDASGNPMVEQKVTSEGSLPANLKNLNYINKSDSIDIIWDDAPEAAHKTEYLGGEKIILRLSKTTDKSGNPIGGADILYDIYSQKNPIKNAKENANYQNFVNAEPTGYLDFIFDHEYVPSGVAQTINSGGNIEVRYLKGKFTVKGIDEGYYRTQIYTMKYSSPNPNAGYMVQTLEGEVLYNAPNPANASSGLRTYYRVADTVALDFPNVIQSEIITKAPRALYLTTSAIAHGLLDTSNPNSEIVGVLKYKGARKTGEMHVDSAAETEATNYYIVPTESGIKYPLDIVFVYDKTGPTEYYKNQIETAINDLHTYILNNTDYIPGYQLIDVDEHNANEKTSDWAETPSNISGLHSNWTGNEPGKVNSIWGIEKAIKLLHTKGRTTENGNPSKRWIIMFSNTYTYETPSPDFISKELREKDILLSGLTGVKHSKLLTVDDMGRPGNSPHGGDDQEQHYGHLKFIAPDNFKIYQISENIYNSLKHSLGAIGVTQRWILTYTSPYPIPDAKIRQALFDIEIDFEEVTGTTGPTLIEDIGIATDRQYIAPGLAEERSEFPNQVILFNNEIGINYLNTEKYKIDDEVLPPGSRGYRRMKTISYPAGPEQILDAVTDFNKYTSISAFNLDRSIYQWDYLLANTITKGLMMEKISENGKGKLQKGMEIGSTQDMLTYAYEDTLRDFKISENEGDKVVYTWKGAEPNKYGSIFQTEKIMFRIVKNDVGGTTGSGIANYKYKLYEDDPASEEKGIELLKYHYNIYDKKNNIHIYDSTGNAINPLKYNVDDILGLAGDQVDANYEYRGQQIAAFNEGVFKVSPTENIPMNYLDVIFDYDKPMEVYAGTVSFLYADGSFQISGLPVGEYALEVFTLKREVNRYKVWTLEKIEDKYYSEFKMDFNEAIKVGRKVNNFFMIEKISTEDFLKDDGAGGKLSRVKVNFLTKAEKELVLSGSAVNMGGTITVDPTQPVTIVDTVYPANHLSAGEMSEIKTINPKVRLEAENTIGGGEIRLYPSKGAEVKFPVDIVLCIDTSFSMDDEIQKTKQGLTKFSKMLYDRGYDVKYNLVTFGPRQNTNDYSQNGHKYVQGAWNGKTYKYEDYVKDKPYMTIYKEKWFDATSGRPATRTITPSTSREQLLEWELLELQDALNEMKPASGFTGGQENSITAIWYAKELLRNNGRGIDIESKITEDKTKIKEPSIKWVIVLTDENADDDNVKGFSNSGGLFTNVATELMKNLGDEIRLTLLCHVNVSGIATNSAWWLKDKTSDERTANKAIMKVTDNTVYDDRNIKGRLPSDREDSFLSEFRFTEMGDYLDVYEIGATGEHVGAALEHAAEGIGVIQRWVLDYKSPFPLADGSKREVDYILETGKVAAKVGDKLEVFSKEIEDYNYELDANNKPIKKTENRKNREYIVPNDNMEVKPEDPRIPDTPFTIKNNTAWISYVARLRYTRQTDDGSMQTQDEIIREGVLRIYGTVDKLTDGNKNMADWGKDNGGNYLLEIPLRYQENQTHTNRGIIVSPLTESGYEGTEGWYQLCVQLTEAEQDVLINSKMKYFHLHEIGKTTVSGELIVGNAYTINHTLDNDPPKIEKIVIENKMLRDVWAGLKKNNGDNLYGNSEDMISDNGILHSDPSSAGKYSTLRYDIEAGTNIFSYPAPFKTGMEYTKQIITKDSIYCFEDWDGGFSTFSSATDGRQDSLKITIVYVEQNPAQTVGDTFDWEVAGLTGGKQKVTFRVESEADLPVDGGKRLVAQGIYSLDGKAPDYGDLILEPNLVDAMNNNVNEAIESIVLTTVDNIAPTADDVGKEGSTLEDKINTFNVIGVANGKYAKNEYALTMTTTGTKNKISNTGLRAYDVRFTYNFKESDRLEVGPAANYAENYTANYRKTEKYGTPPTEDDVNQNYKFQIDGGSTAVNIAVDTAKHYDDGSYIYTLHMYDKAGNVGPKDKTDGRPLLAGDNKLYVDTIAPRLVDDTGADFTKVDYKLGTTTYKGWIHTDHGVAIKTGGDGIYFNDLFKNTDRFQVYLETKDYNLDNSPANVDDIFGTTTSTQTVTNVVNGTAETITLSGINLSEFTVNDNNSDPDGKKHSFNIKINDKAGNSADAQVKIVVNNTIPNMPIMAAIAGEVAQGTSSHRAGAEPNAAIGGNNLQDRYDNRDLTRTPVEPYADMTVHFTAAYGTNGAGVTEYAVLTQYETTPTSTGAMDNPHTIISIDFEQETETGLASTGFTDLLNGAYTTTINTGGTANQFAYGTSSNIGHTTAPPDGVNTTKVKVWNQFGSFNTASNMLRIVVDKAINTNPLGGGGIRRLPGAGGIATYVSGDANFLRYNFTINMNDSSIKEFSGLWQLQLNRVYYIANTNVNAEVAGHNYWRDIDPEGKLNKELTDVNATCTIGSFPIPVNSVMIGGTVRLVFTLKDNLGNIAEYFADFAIPDRSTGIKAREAGSEREVEIKTKVGEDIKIGERKEGGKND